MAEWLQQNELLDSVGGLQYLAELSENTPSAANIAAYADIVRERSVLRLLVRAGTDIADSGYRTRSDREFHLCRVRGLSNLHVIWQSGIHWAQHTPSM